MDKIIALKEILKKLFTGRMNRRDYFLRMFWIYYVFMVGVYLAKEELSFLGIKGYIMICLLIEICVIPFKVRRLHDINLSGWYLILLSPLAEYLLTFLSKHIVFGAYLLIYITKIPDVFLLIAKGTSGQNKYGDVPSDDKKKDGIVDTEKTSQSRKIKLIFCRVLSGICLGLLLIMLYQDMRTTGALCYHYIPFTYHLAEYFSQPWPFSITLIFPIILCSILNLALWFPCRYGYLFIKSFLIAIFGLIAQAIITVILQFLRFFVSIGNPNVLPSIGRIIAPLFFGSEIAAKWGFCYLLYHAIKKWSGNNIREDFQVPKGIMKKEGIVGAGIILMLLGCTIPLEKSISGNFLIPSQVKKDKFELTFYFKRQEDWQENQFAIWMEDYHGAYIKTLYVSKEVMDWNAEKKLLPKWSKTVETAGEKREDLEKIAKPVPPSGQFTYLWDGTDRYGSTEYGPDEAMRSYIICYIESYGASSKYALYSGIFSWEDGTSDGFVGTPDGKICEKTENKTIKNIEGHFRGAHVNDYARRTAWIKKYGLFFR